MIRVRVRHPKSARICDDCRRHHRCGYEFKDMPRSVRCWICREIEPCRLSYMRPRPLPLPRCLECNQKLRCPAGCL
jgi:hypothetical protein